MKIVLISLGCLLWVATAAGKNLRKVAQVKSMQKFEISTDIDLIAQTTEQELTTQPQPTTPFPDEGFNCTANGDGGGAFPHPIHCEYYYLCSEGVDTLVKCQRNYLFDLKYMGCNYPELTDCQERERPPGYPGTTTPPTPTGEPGTPPPGVCDKGDGFYANPLDCAGFYQCLDDIAYQYCCPFPLRYNVDLEVCDFQINVVCGDRPDGDCVKRQKHVLPK